MPAPLDHPIRPPTDEPPYRWAYDDHGALFYDHEPGIPDGLWGEALRTAAHSSLVGLLVGVPLLGDRPPEPWDMFIRADRRTVPPVTSAGRSGGG